MDRCSICALRYKCAGKHQFDCELRGYAFYVPDSKAIEVVQKELDECKSKIGGRPLVWKKGNEPLPVVVIKSTRLKSGRRMKNEK